MSKPLSRLKDSPWIAIRAELREVSPSFARWFQHAEEGCEHCSGPVLSASMPNGEVKSVADQLVECPIGGGAWAALVMEEHFFYAQRREQQ